MPDICSEMMLFALSKFDEAASSADEYAPLAWSTMESAAAAFVAAMAARAKIEVGFMVIDASG